MDSQTGKLYDSREAAIAAGVPKDRVIELLGPSAQVRRVADTMSARHKAERRAKNKRAKASRKRNR